MSRLVNEYGEPIYDDALEDEDNERLEAYHEGYKQGRFDEKVEQETNFKGKIADFFEKYPHEVSEVICVKCGKRWISVRPQGTLLKNIKCPNCGKGYVIKTGEEMQDAQTY